MDPADAEVAASSEETKQQRTVTFQPIRGDEDSVAMSASNKRTSPSASERNQANLAYIHGLGPDSFARFSQIVLRMASIDPYERRRKPLLWRAFTRWNECAPLVRKCNELKFQLQERTAVFDSLHGSYLKDVIAVTYHLKNIEELVAEKLSYDLYDIDAMPLTQIRSVIQKAHEIRAQTSVQFRESLLNAGLLEDEADAQKNVWEKSRAYVSYQKRKHEDTGEFAFPREPRYVVLVV